MTTVQRISLRKGDSSDFFYTITINITGDQDLTGWKAYFQIGNTDRDDATILKKAVNITNRQIPIVLTAIDTSKMDVGVYRGYLKFVKPNGAVGTAKQFLTVEITEQEVDISGRRAV